MSIAGDARFLSWGLHLEPSHSTSRIRYLLFFDIRNHKLLLINLGNQQISSYDFSCVANCNASKQHNTLVTLNLSNSKQSYTVYFYFDSNYDRDCVNTLLSSIIDRTIIQTAPKYGITAQLEIGCQIQKILINPKNKHRISDWQPRILSLIQNRILLFGDKSVDYHPLQSISLSTPNFSLYKVECYDNTVSIQCCDTLIYQLHLGDTHSLLSFIQCLKSALELYNKSAINRFNPHKIPPNIAENDNAHSETDDNETDTECNDIITNAHIHSNDSTLHPIHDRVDGSRHIAQFSNQTDCKLQQPISPILDAADIAHKVHTSNTPKLEQSNPLSVIDQDGNEVLPLIRNQSRNITPTEEENMATLRTRSIVQKPKNLQSYKHGSIDNIGRKSRRKRKKNRTGSDSNSQSQSQSRSVSKNSSNKSDKVRKHKNRNKSKAKSRKHRSKSRSRSKRHKTREKRSASNSAKPLPKLPPKTRTKMHSKIVSNSGSNLGTEEYDEREEQKREISASPMNAPQLQLESHSKSAPGRHINVGQSQPMNIKRSVSLLQSESPIIGAQTVTPETPDMPGEVWRYTSKAKAQSVRNDHSKLVSRYSNESGMVKSQSTGQHRYSSGSNINPFSYAAQNQPYYYKHNYTYQQQTQYSLQKTVQSPITPSDDNHKKEYFNFASPPMSPRLASQTQAQKAPTPPPTVTDSRNISEMKLRLRAPKWDKPFDLSNENSHNLCTHVWGNINPKSMFPNYKHPIIPYLSDALSAKQLYNVSVAKEGYHCLGIGVSHDWCFVFGEAKEQIGVLGLGTNAMETTPFLLRSLRKQRVKQCCCSALHSLCITEELLIYGWGSKRLTLLQSDTNAPTLLEFLNHKKLRSLACCNTHSLAWNPHKSIHLYSWGTNGPWLGYDNASDNGYAHSMFGLVKFDHYIYAHNKYAIASADCSAQYTLILLNTGYVGCCGINEYGRMGIGKRTIATSKVLWHSSHDLSKIIRVSAGQFHSGFVDVFGRVYTVGLGSEHRLGHGNDKKNLYKPKMIESLQRMKAREIECVDKRTYIVSTAGQLILFGKECGNNGKTHRNAFVYTHLNAYRVYNVCGSSEFALINCVKLDGASEGKTLALPDIDGLRQSTNMKLNESNSENESAMIGGISQFVKVQKKAKKLKPKQKRNPFSKKDSKSIALLHQIQSDTKLFVQNRTNNVSNYVEFANPSLAHYTNPNSVRFKRSSSVRHSHKYYSSKRHTFSSHDSPNRYSPTSDSIHHYRQRKDTPTTHQTLTRPRAETDSGAIAHTQQKISKQKMKFGKCNQANCHCTQFVKSHSKWSKGKCKACSHQRQYHKQM